MQKTAGFFANLATFLAIIAVVLSVLFFPFAFLSAGVADVTADQELVIDLTSRHFIESDLLYAWLVNIFLSSESEPGNDSADDAMRAVLLDLPVEDQILISKLLLPRDWAAAEIKMNLNEAYAWLQGMVDFPYFSLHTKSLSESMTLIRADRVAQVLVDSWPACLPEVINRYQSGELSMADFLSDACKPREARAHEYLVNQLKESVMEMYTVLPDEVALLKDVDQEALDQANNARSTILQLYRLMTLGWLIPVFLLGIVMVLRIRSWRELGTWWGGPLLAAGIFTIPAGIFVPGLGVILLRVIERNTDQPAVRINLLRPLLLDLFTQARGMILLSSFILIFAGAFLLILVFGFLERKTQKLSVAKNLYVDKTAGIISDIKTSGSNQPLEEIKEDDTPSGMFG